MKICILTERMKLGFGVDIVVDEQAKRLAAMGHEIVVVVIHADIVQPARDYRLVIVNRYFGQVDYHAHSTAVEILQFGDVADADLYILHTPPFYDWARVLDAPVVFVEHGAPPGRFFPEAIGRQIDAMAEKRLGGLYKELQDYDAIVSISQTIHDWLPPYAQAKSTVIHNGIDHYAKVNPDEITGFRRSLGISPKEVVILWVGRMQLAKDEQPYKGFEELLALLPLVKRYVTQAKVVLAGRVSAQDKQALEDMGLLILGNCTTEQMSCALASADILINLSKWEGFNLVLLEAQFQGTPVIAYDYGPHSEIVRDGKTGVLARRSQDFFQAVIEVCNDESMRSRMADEALHFARSFTWDRSVGQLMAIIEKCVAKAPSPEKIMEDRRASASAARSLPREDTGQHVSSAPDLLRLGDRAFVRAAYRAITAEELESGQEVSWHRMLKKEDRATVLFEMLDCPNAQGLATRNPQLLASLNKHKWTYSYSKPLRQMYKRSLAAVTWTHEVRLDLHAEALISHAFRVLLGREAEPPAVKGYADQIGLGKSRQSVLREIRESEEGRHRPLTDPDLTAILMEGKRSNLTELFERCIQIATLGASLPFTKWHEIDDAEFIRQAYLGLLGRPPAQIDVDNLMAQLRDGCSRRHILSAIRFSDEGRQRPLLDPELRRILFFESLYRSRPFSGVFRRLRFSFPERENAARRLRRLDSRQRALRDDVTHLTGLKERLNPAEALVSIVNRLDALERRLATLQTGAPALDAPQHLHGGPDIALLEPDMLKLGQGHVALLAFGAKVQTSALDKLQKIARSNDCDIIIGDESERVDESGTLRLRRNGPFHQETFLDNPDLGGVVAVRGEFLKLLQLSNTTALSARLSLDLVALAHTIAYVPEVLCERATADILGNRANEADLRKFVGQMSGEFDVIEHKDQTFEVRPKSTKPWKAVVVSHQSDGATYQVAVSLARSGEVAPADRERQSITPLWSKSGPSLSRLINEAVGEAPPDFDLILFIHHEIVAKTRDWLPRLAAIALMPGTGAVAPKTFYPDGRVRHAGIEIGSNGFVRYTARFDRRRPGGDQMGRDGTQLDMLKNVSAVSLNCMMVRRATFLDCGGFDEKLSVEAFDIDFCLRLKECGLAILMDGRVVMTQPDQNPRWTRTMADSDVNILDDKHSVTFAETKSHELCGDDVGGAVSGQSLYVSVLPIIRDR